MSSGTHDRNDNEADSEFLKGLRDAYVSNADSDTAYAEEFAGVSAEAGRIELDPRD